MMASAVYIVQMDDHARTSSLNFYRPRMLPLMSIQPAVSNSKHWRHNVCERSASCRYNGQFVLSHILIYSKDGGSLYDPACNGDL